MSRVVVVGKVIVDEIVGRSFVTIGGGAPQAAFGAAVVSEHAPLLVAVVGEDVRCDQELMRQLMATGADLGGVVFVDLPTPRYRIEIGGDDIPIHGEGTGFERWNDILEIELPLPVRPERRPTDVMHVLVERGGYADLRLARRWKAQSGGFLSFEPVILRDSPAEQYDAIREYIPLCDCISPDWHTACRIAQLPEEVR